jgi:hypothetical protein
LRQHNFNFRAFLKILGTANRDSVAGRYRPDNSDQVSSGVADLNGYSLRNVFLVDAKDERAVMPKYQGIPRYDYR